MRTTTSKSQKVLKYTTKATLSDLYKYTGTKPQELMAEAARLGYTCCGPQIWQYTGADGKPGTEFKLEIMLPIQGCGNGSKPCGFNTESLGEFKALQQLHEGPWSQIGSVYCSLMRHIAENGLKATGITREVYIRVDFEHQENCITEVLIGLE